MKRMRSVPEKIRAELLLLADEDYKKFHASLVPNVSPDQIIGIRIPVLRKYASVLAKNHQNNVDMLVSAFELPHRYYEEYALHGMLIERLVDYDRTVEELNRFLPYVDNWATCDMLKNKLLAKHPERTIAEIDKWLASGRTYTVRFAIKQLMDIFLGVNFKNEYADRVADIRSDEYYVKMMQAWYFATALAKNYVSIVEYLRDERLDVWTHNKTISKACDSYRITPEQKEYLKSLRKK